MSSLPKYQNAIKKIENWFAEKDWKPFDFQYEVWDEYLSGGSGLVHSSTGTGKTYAAWLGPVIEELTGHKFNKKTSKIDSKKKSQRDLTEPHKILWITPLRALAADTKESLLDPVNYFGLNWSVEIRSGDTSSTLRAKQKKRLPTALITTPESLSLLLSYTNSENQFKNLEAVIVDEWHELIGSKRGVLAELCIARLKKWRPGLKIWGLSATLGNTKDAMQTLLGNDNRKGKLIKGHIPKKLVVDSIIPDEVNRFPSAGHLGIKLLDKVIAEIDSAESCLVFTNTRSQTEIWYREILDARPDLSGIIAVHHGSLDKKNRKVVEDLLRSGKMKCVVCTSSLDLGVDFSPVDKVLQIGSPKGVARLMQRAGRSGHQPNSVSRVICVPTNSFELIEIAAARKAIEEKAIESRIPVELAIDVLSQHLVTIALGNGFREPEMFKEIKTTNSFKNLSKEVWKWVLEFITSGGAALRAYPEYSRVIKENGIYRVENKSIARRHRMSIGTITSDSAMLVKFLKGGSIGTIEEQFISRLKKGDVFVFAGRLLEYVRIREMTVWVRLAKRKDGQVPQWLGGRMPLSTELAASVREMLEYSQSNPEIMPELEAVQPVISLQSRWSTIPKKNELLIERYKSKEGYHLFFYPFEGYLVHEGLAALLGYRISKITTISFSISINDYGFELLSDQPIPLTEALENNLFGSVNLIDDILASLNSSEMAKRQFREIARIAGLVIQGFPGQEKTAKQIQASSSLFFEVFKKYDPDNLFLKQATREVLDRQLESERLKAALNRLAENKLKIVELENPSPLAFPIMVNRLRANISSEKLADRVKRMQLSLVKKADRKDSKEYKLTKKK